MSDGHWIRSGKDIEYVLDMYDKTSRSVLVNFAPWSGPQEALYDRILMGLSEGVGYFANEEQHQMFVQISWAFPIVAYYHFSANHRVAVVSRYFRAKADYFGSEATEMTLLSNEAAVLARVCAKADIQFNPEITELSFHQLELDLKYYKKNQPWFYSQYS